MAAGPTPPTFTLEAPTASPSIFTDLPSVTHLYCISRAVYAGGVQREVGEVVDVSSWRTVDALIRSRHLAPLSYNTPDPETCACGRMWLPDTQSDHPYTCTSADSTQD